MKEITLTLTRHQIIMVIFALRMVTGDCKKACKPYRQLAKAIDKQVESQKVT